MIADTIILNELNITPFVKAQDALVRVLSEPKTDITRDAAIQRFEFTFELAWKTLKKVLMFKGLRVNNPRDVFRDAARMKLIADPVIWFSYLDNRNQTSHTYNEDIADKIYQTLPDFSQHVQQLIDTLQRL